MGKVIMSGIVPQLHPPVHIYGVAWAGTSATTFARTDDSANFSEPNPYYAGMSGTPSSPFDNLMPWAGMVRVSDPEAGELVAIPKFWYKMEKIGNGLKLQIADGPVDGFLVSPAHVDRGDGKGERDMVYVGRYHCASNYKSQTRSEPITPRRDSARSSIHNLGTTIWQFDFAMRQTIQMLYLVEFADWNSQVKIGYGCGNDDETEAMGGTDSMPYHTGTRWSSRSTYGVGVQYRYIEGLWDNVNDWLDGCYYNHNGLNIIMNPNNFSDSSNGTLVGIPSSSGYPTVMGLRTVGGVHWMYPTAVGGSDTTYIPDQWSWGGTTYADSFPWLSCGGDYSRYLQYGLFYASSEPVASSRGIGCRLMKLP